MGRLSNDLSALRLEPEPHLDEQDATLEGVAARLNRFNSSVNDAFNKLRSAVAGEDERPKATWQPIGKTVLTSTETEMSVGPIDTEIDGQIKLELDLVLVTGTTKDVRLRPTSETFGVTFQSRVLLGGASAVTVAGTNNWTICQTSTGTRLWGELILRTGARNANMYFYGQGGYGTPGTNTNTWQATGSWTGDNKVKGLVIDTTVASKLAAPSTVRLYRKALF